MPTIRDIATKLGVSPGTVSKGLNGAKDISETMRQKILETAVEMGYTKRSSVKQEKRRLAIFMENMDYYMEDDFGYDIILGFKQAAFKENWDVDVIPLSHDFQRKRSYDSFMLDGGFSGALLNGMAYDDPWMKEFSHTRTPAILLDNFIRENPMVGSVGTDSTEGIEMAVRHLASLGHEKIAFLNGSKGSMISEVRMNAFQQAMNAVRLPIIPELCAYDYFVSHVAAKHVNVFLDHGATAILCGNDLIAYGVIEACGKEGFSVPEDISVIGYDDLPSSALTNPPLTTIRQDRVKLGKCSYYVLYALINGVSLSRNLLRPSLTVRASTSIAKPRVSLARLGMKPKPKTKTKAAVK